jgi:hypothetical protein
LMRQVAENNCDGTGGKRQGAKRKTLTLCFEFLCSRPSWLPGI